jgi:hypothetical protein
MDIKKSISSWISNITSHVATKKRESLLYPNKNSRVKVEEYELPLTQALTFGKIEFFFPQLAAMPLTVFKPKEMTCNVPWAGFIFITDVKVANVSASVSNHIVDAYSYNPQSAHRSLHLPTLSERTTISVSGFYQGDVPNECLQGKDFFFCCTFRGYAEMAGK